MPAKFKKIFIILSAVAVIAGGLFWFAQISNAQQGPDLGLAQVSSTIGLPTTDIRVIVANIIRTALGLLGIVALVLVLYGGYTWMTAGGNEEKIAQAKKILVNAVIGLAIILSAYAITSFIISSLLGATTGTPAHCFDGIQNEGETAVDCGGGGCGPCTAPNNPYFTSGAFYITALPAGGQVCIRNVNPAITFNMDVDAASLAGSVVLLDNNNNEQAGVWSVVDGNTAKFTPVGACGAPDNGNDCLLASTNYTLHFKNGGAIKSADGRAINCLAGAKCTDVQFTTGDGIDRTPPTVKIENIADDKLVTGQVVPVKISYTDDNGVQKIDLKADNNYVGSGTVSGCQKTGSVTINWPTAGLSDGAHGLDAKGYDWSMQSAVDHYAAILKPPHCLNNILDGNEDQAGPLGCCAPEKNCGCGGCGGSSCTQDTDCASGYCKIPPGQTTGVCVDRMRITGVSPGSGAVGTYVSISGEYFGTARGQVYFTGASGWLVAPLADCGAGAWKPWQVIATVPQGAITGPIRLITADQQFVDVTNDNVVGPLIPDFVVNNLVRPGICSLDKTNGLPSDSITISGKNFGAVQLANSAVSFGQLQAFINVWGDTTIKTKVPMLSAGPAAVKVTKENIDSNSVAFFVGEGINSTTPTITSISPDHGAKGEYLTITGNNFGAEQGRVWFKVNNNGQPANDQDAINGSFDFPAGCKDNIWSDSKIIVKFPESAGQTGQTYFVQVRPSEIDKGWSPIGPTFKLETGNPAPGICGISPASGPVPFGTGADPMKIYGEYFGGSPDVYFWNTNADASTITGRIKAANPNISGSDLNVFPPNNTQTGPVVVFRSSDSKMSNSALFTVSNCVQNGNSCSQAGYHCCAAGPEAGMCKTDLCIDEKISAGYIWRFATQPIPKVPHLVERCDSQSDAGKNVPSPSPSVQWDTNDSGDHHNVCRTASIVLDFSVDNINPIPRGDILVSECESSTVNVASRTCTQLTPRPSFLGSGDYVVEHSTQSTNDLELDLSQDYNNNTGKWKDNTWYQVILSADISAGAGTALMHLAKDAPCDSAGITNTAYCFLFKTDAKDCKIKAVAITPYSYWASVLEAPIKYRSSPSDEGVDLVYSGHILSDQHCIWMNPGGLNWDWNVANPDPNQKKYADVFALKEDTVVHKTDALISALANTVGVGLANNSVDVEATVSTGTVSHTGSSPLKIDLNTPEVVDYWPKCNEACANAEVGAKFNTTMSDLNLDSGAVHLYKCLDENCAQTQPVVLPSVSFEKNSNPPYTLLEINNYGLNHVDLEPNTIYEVVLSASSSNPNSPDQLWSASSLLTDRDADGNVIVIGRSGTSKPYNKQFIWKFTTKQTSCAVDRTEVLPSVFTARQNNDRAVFNVQPYSAPDACSVKGQKLNPWSENWVWSSSDVNAATVATFSTQGYSPYCTSDCIRRGSTLPAGSDTVPLCGSGGNPQAGQDCVFPDKNNNCSLNCLFINKTNTGSAQSAGATSVSSSVCGNGFLGTGEDCDIGIPANPLSPTSSMYCSNKCLHLGAPLASSWCNTHFTDYAGLGFTKTEFEAACAKAISVCGDKVLSPDEDPGCDGSGGWDQNLCNRICLLKSNNAPTDNAPANSCSNGGCNLDNKHAGSSLLYSTPSVCGDKAVGIGEDVSCENNNFITTDHVGKTDPWALVLGKGLSTNVGGTPPAQSSTISATANVSGKNIAGQGQFVIPCGYKTDAECKNALGDDYGLGANSCCYKKPVLTKVYPGTTSTPIAQNVCPNTVIEAQFSNSIDAKSLPGNLLIARGIGENFSTNLNIDSTVGLSGSSHVFVSGNYAYVANSLNGLNVINISDSKHPLPIWTPLNTANYADVYVIGKYAYIVDQGANSLKIFDISSSTNPTVVGSVDLVNITNPNRIVVSGKFAYVISANGGNIINVANPAGPTFSTKLSISPRQIQPAGNNIALLDNNNFTIMDFSDPANPRTIGSVQVNDAQDFKVSGNYAFLAGTGGLQILDISNPANPHSVAALTAGSLSSINVYNSLVFATDASGAIHIIDVSDPAIPKNLEVYTGLVHAGYVSQNIAVSGNYAYAVHSSGLTIVDVSKYTNNCPANSDVTNLIVLNSPNANLPWYEKIWTNIVQFVKSLFGFTATAQSNTPTKWCAGLDLGTPAMLSSSTIMVKLQAPLALDTSYAIILKHGLKDTNGVSIDTSTNWRFVTAPKICQVSGVSVTPNAVAFGSVGQTSTLEAKALAASGGEIQIIPGYYAWEYVWGPSSNAFVTLTNTTSSLNMITAQNRNGELDVWASANITDNKYTSQTGPAATGKSHVIVFLCENPWPPKNLYYNNQGPFMIFPYEDKLGNNDNYNLTADSFDNTALPASPFGGYFNFRTYYCADNGAPGTADDLPYMRAAVQVSPTIVSDATAFKRFIFTSAKNNDAIGIQVFPNTQHLTVEQWFQYGKTYGGQGFVTGGNMQPTTIDGYDALSDGNNIYVDALNYATTSPVSGNLYTNVYLFSINADARPETRKVFEQMINNWHFNINLTNYRRCGVDVESPGDTSCQTDLDCSGGQICSAQIDKLKRNYQRLRDLNEIQKALGQ
ncbi:MAG: Ig-like domain-containing protein [Patescibacteria group bacterium]